MAYTPLSCCISRNRQIFGQDYSLLGSYTRGRKTLLSYDARNGWNIARLNRLQLLFRKIFGFYKSTHLDPVYKSWKSEKLKARIFKNDPLDRRIKTLFHRPKRTFCILGNTTVNRAKIFCFPEIHGDSLYRKAAAQFINQHYRSGDIVLIEGVEAGEKERNQQVDHLSKECLVQGWEPPGVMGLLDAERESNEMLKKISSTFGELLAHIDVKTPDLSILESRKSSFISNVHQLTAYFDPTGTLGITKERLEQFFHMLQNNKVSFMLFCSVIKRLLLKLGKRQEIVLYDHFSEKDCRTLDSQLNVRNHSLCLEIQKHRSAGKRVFVFAGFDHFFRSTLTNPKDTQEIHSLLSRERFVFATKNQMVTGKMLWLHKKLALDCVLRKLKLR